MSYINDLKKTYRDSFVKHKLVGLSIIQFGHFKGRDISELPSSYLFWLQAKINLSVTQFDLVLEELISRQDIDIIKW